MKDKKETLKLAIVAGAASALKYKESKPSASDSEVLKHVTKSIREILEEIENKY